MNRYEVVFLFVPLWWNRSHLSGDWVLLIPLIAFGALLFLGVPAVVFLVSRRRKKRLDAVFTPLGLVGKPYLLIWWEYTGAMDGRKVNARFYRGPTLDISLQTCLHTHGASPRKGQPGLFLADLAGCQPLPWAGPALQNLRVFALDEAWTRTVLELPETQAPLLRLMTGGATMALIRYVALLPGYLRLTLYRNTNLFDYSFTTAEVRQWQEDLQALVRAAESIPPPTVTAEETRVERAVRTGKVTRNLVWFVIGFFALIAVVMAIAFGLILALGG